MCVCACMQLFCYDALRVLARASRFACMYLSRSLSAVPPPNGL